MIRIIMICSILDKKYNRGQPDSHLTLEDFNIRVFLSAYLIVAHPNNLFEYCTDIVNRLKESAESMLLHYESICNVYKKKDHDTAELLETTNGFLGKVFLFMKSFKDWKTPDSKIFLSRVKIALKALMEARKHALDSDSNSTETLEELNFQINRLRNKIITVAGAEALENFDKETDSISVVPSNTESTQRDVDFLDNRMTNEQLAHELLLDPTFVLTSDRASGCHNALSTNIKEAFSRAFWKSISNDLEQNPPIFSRVLRVLKEIRDGTAELCTQGHLLQKVSEVLDICFISTQLENNSFGWESCTLMVQATFKIFAEVEENKYNEKTMEMASRLLVQMNSNPNKPQVFSEALEAMLNKLNDIRVQSANQRLRLIAPVITAHGIEYERGKMREKLESGQLNLDNVRKMAAQAVEEMVHENDLQVAITMSTATNKALFHSCYAKFMVNVLNTRPLNKTTCPETLLMDTEKCLSFQRSLFYLTTTATTSALVKNFSKDPKVIIVFISYNAKGIDFNLSGP